MQRGGSFGARASSELRHQEHPGMRRCWIDRGLVLRMKMHAAKSPKKSVRKRGRPLDVSTFRRRFRRGLSKGIVSECMLIPGRSDCSSNTARLRVSLQVNVHSVSIDSTLSKIQSNREEALLGHQKE